MSTSDTSGDEVVAEGVPTPDGDAGVIQTDYTIGQDNIEGRLGKLGFDIHNPVFVVSAGVIILFVIYALIFQQQASDFFGWLRPTLTSTFDWFFLTAGNIFVVFCLFLICSPWGKIRLGGTEAEPDFSYAG